MGLSLDVSNKIFFVIGIIFELWFILMYAIDYRYIFYQVAGSTLDMQKSYGFISVQGFIMVLFLLLLFFLGFTLVNTYVAGSAYSNALFSFLILVFTIQYYFIIRSFWIGVGLGNDAYNNTLGTGEPKMIRIHTTDFRLNSSVNTNIGMTQAIVCSLSMLVAYMAVAGRVNSFHIFILCFFGVFFYGFNQIVIWRHAISDNAYTLRLFLFGSSFGLLTGLLLRLKDRESTTNTLGYLATRHTRTYGLIGTCFSWLFLPILAAVNTIYDPNTIPGIMTYLYPSIINMWFALSASCSCSFAVSILLGYKIHPHDIVYSSFTGAIAYGATSTLNSHPFPALLIGLIVGILTTILNHKLKKPLNNPDVIDTNGTIFTFWTAALLGGIYSAILAAFYCWGPDVVTSVNTSTQVVVLRWLPYGRTKFSQGGLQIAATFISIGIGFLSALPVGLIAYLTSQPTSDTVYNDQAFAQVADEDNEANRA